MTLTSLIGSGRATTDARTLETSTSPSDGTHLFEFAHASMEDVNEAVETARRSRQMSSWANLKPDARGSLLWRVATLVEEHADELADMDARDPGMPMAGTVFINLLPLIDPGAPWGGFGLSGWGREMGAYAIDEFTEPKGVFVGLGS